MKKKYITSKYLSKLIYILKGKHWELLLIVILFLLTSTLETFGIGLVGPFIAVATNSQLIHENELLKLLNTKFGFTHPNQMVTLLGAIIVALTLFKSFLNFHVQKYIFSFGFGLQSDLRVKLLNSYLNVPYTFHLNRNTASLIQTIISETTSFANHYLMPLLFSVSHLTIITALLILLVQTDLLATLSVLIVLMVIGFFLYRFKDYLYRWGKQAHQADVAMIQVINHSLGGFKETKVIGCEKYFESQLVQYANEFKKANINANTFSLLPRFTLEPLLISFLVCFTIISIIIQRTPQDLVAVLGIFGMAAVRLLPATSNFMQAMGAVRLNSYITTQLYLDLKEVEVDESRNLNFMHHIQSGLYHKSNLCDDQSISFNHQITLKDISYSYPQSIQPSLNKISFQIKKGQSIGLIGKSGAGKTTLVDVILGLLNPQVGKLTVDGVPIIEKNLRDWQNLIGYIPQNIFLMDDSIERNIAFGVVDDQINIERLSKAIKAAQLTELIEQLPDGVKTLIGERGVRLSGGQRQRIGIARALYHQREVLILDEATAALDNETENYVTESIKALSGMKTIIIIAHRLTTIEHCDYVYVLDKGTIVNSGSYRDVVIGNQATR